jgi:RHS repeat-associated protein
MRGIIKVQKLTAFIAALGVSLSAMTVAEPKLYFVHNDHLGTPQLLTDENQTIVWQTEYTPFGEATINEDPDGDGTAVEFNLRFPGQYFDKETQTSYNYYRTYDPKLGRYIQSDPIGLEGGVNTYGYVSGNPITRFDPFGLVEWHGTQTTLAAGEGGGAVRFKFSLESECVNGKKARVEVVAGGFAVMAGVPLSATHSRSVTFNDNKQNVDPFVFSGSSKYVYASYALISGGSVQWIQLGDATAKGGGFQMGYDTSVVAGAGISTVTFSEIVDCECEVGE